jgi:hypothetical protein
VPTGMIRSARFAALAPTLRLISKTRVRKIANAREINNRLLQQNRHNAAEVNRAEHVALPG